MKTKGVLFVIFVAAAMFAADCLAVTAKYVPNEIIVKFKHGVTDEAVRTVLASQRGSVIYTSPFAGFHRVRIPRGRNVEKMVELFQKNPDVEYAVPNSIVYAHMVPNDPGYSLYQWNFDDRPPGSNPYGGTNGGGINLEPAWDISTGSGAVAAVLDSGVAFENFGTKYIIAPDLVNTNFVDGWDFVNTDSHPNDDNSHGTHVAGTIAQSTDNSLGVAGVAFGCSIMPVKVLNKNGSGTLQQLVDGIYFAANNGADVINMSLGFPPGYDPGQLLKDALDYAYDHNVTVVCSSGNDYASTVSYPAAHWTTIAVGATRFDETRVSYSNYGTALDLMAPGGDLSVDQNNDGYADGILQNTFDPRTKDPRDFSYWLFSGTSMAAPHVSGVAALLIAHGLVTPDDVRYAVESTAEDKGTAGWDAQYGWGIVDAYAALNAPPDPSRRYTLSDDQLMTFDDTSVSPLYYAALESKEDVTGFGVQYDVELAGFGAVVINLGSVPSQTDLSGYSSYALTITNTSTDDFFTTSVYVRTGPNMAFSESRIVTLMPGASVNLSLDLTSVPNRNDVREVGFTVTVFVGQGFGLADNVLVKAQRRLPQ